MANVSGAVQIETGIKHRLSIPFQSVAVEQSIDVGTLLISTQNEENIDASPPSWQQCWSGVKDDDREDRNGTNAVKRGFVF
jgi:hypothetical protein